MSSPACRTEGRLQRASGWAGPGVPELWGGEVEGPQNQARSVVSGTPEEMRHRGQHCFRLDLKLCVSSNPPGYRGTTRPV